MTINDNLFSRTNIVSLSFYDFLFLSPPYIYTFSLPTILLCYHLFIHFWLFHPWLSFLSNESTKLAKGDHMQQNGSNNLDPRNINWTFNSLWFAFIFCLIQFWLDLTIFAPLLQSRVTCHLLLGLSEIIFQKHNNWMWAWKKILHQQLLKQPSTSKKDIR